MIEPGETVIEKFSIPLERYRLLFVCMDVEERQRAFFGKSHGPAVQGGKKDRDAQNEDFGQPYTDTRCSHQSNLFTHTPGCSWNDFNSSASCLTGVQPTVAGLRWVGEGTVNVKMREKEGEHACA
jgi:hypothetical protein